ncbi:unnamed protein product [Merluccius merluccius]
MVRKVCWSHSCEWGTDDPKLDPATPTTPAMFVPGQPWHSPGLICTDRSYAKPYKPARMQPSEHKSICDHHLAPAMQQQQRRQQQQQQPPSE